MVYIFSISLFLLLYIYIWYPLAIYLLAKFFAYKISWKKDRSDLPFISIVIPVRNEELSIEKKIINTLHLEYPSDKIEIIIVDSSSTDWTQAIVAHPQFIGKVTLKVIDHLWKAYALEKAINEFSKWEFILVTDVSATLDIYALKNALTYFENVWVEWVTSTLIQKKHEESITSSWKTYWEIETFIRRYETLFYSCIGFTGKFSLFKKETFKDKKWYFPSDADDFDMALFIVKNGGRVLQADDVFAFENAPKNAQDVTQQRQRIIVQTMNSLLHYRSLFRLSRFWYILFSRKLLPLLSPILFLISFFSFAVLSFSTPIFLYFFIFLVLLIVIYVGKIQISFLKFLYYVILLNIVICKSYIAFWAWKDFTKWDKINSTRI